jgi:elongation factor Ts
MAIDINLIKQLREETGAGIADCRMALEESDGDMAKAREALIKKGIERADKKADREIKAGLVYSYIHNGRVGAMIEMGCETDFVAKTDDFVNLCKEVAMQVASMNPESIEEKIWLRG